MNEPDPLDELLAPLRAAFHAKRRVYVGIAEQITKTLEAYLQAADAVIAREISQTHGLPSRSVAPTPDRLAVELLRIVQTLPELRQPVTSSDFAVRSHDLSSGSGSQHVPGAVKPQLNLREPLSDKRDSRGSSPIIDANAATAAWPNLHAAMQRGQLIVVGGPPHLERLKALPAPARENIEWIDTTRQGTHAIGNLERRIRDHRIAAIIILEGLVQHRHTDPLVSAARSVDVPITFAGKGGRAAILLALQELESRLKATD